MRRMAGRGRWREEEKVVEEKDKQAGAGRRRHTLFFSGEANEPEEPSGVPQGPALAPLYLWLCSLPRSLHPSLRQLSCCYSL